MIGKNASYEFVMNCFSVVENEKALETLKALDIIAWKDGRCTVTDRKSCMEEASTGLMAETSTVGLDECRCCVPLDIHGQQRASVTGYIRISSLQSWMHMEKKKSFLQRRKYLMAYGQCSEQNRTWSP